MTEAKARHTHTLKTEQPFFQHIVDGSKTFEIRYNDRGFKVGDILRLEETRQYIGNVYTGLCLDVEVTYVLSGWGLRDDYVCLGIKRFDRQVD